MPNVVLMPCIYCPNPDQSQALGGGFIYIGEPDTDPTIEGNRISVTVTEQDGSTVVIAPADQPLTLGSGGVIIYNGTPIAQLEANQAYSMTIQDANEVQKYYFPNAGIPDIISNVQNGVYTYLTAISGTNIITAEANPTLTAYEDTQVFRFVPENDNTGAATLNIDGLGAGTILLNGAALVGGELQQGIPVQVQVTSAMPTFEIISWAFNSASRNFISQDSQSDMMQEGLGISSVGETLITQATQAEMRETGLGFDEESYLGGAWVSVPYSAGNFSGNGSMTWTVENADVSTFAYYINGKTMTVSFYISASSVGGTPSDLLRIAIPDSKVATKLMTNAITIVDNGVSFSGTAHVNLNSSTLIEIEKQDNSNFTASTNATYVFGQITFEIN